jgi:hypothetical protein
MMMRLAFALALGTGMLVSAQGVCEPIPTCEQCVSHPLCGWCSEDVVYPGGRVGKQCAGFQPGNSTPFQCNGIFSTEQCFQGYVCDQNSGTCQLGAPGTGTSLSKCEANCTLNDHVYICNHTTLKCHIVPAGTPGSASEQVCEASCSSPSPHPAPPQSPAPTPALFACNTTTGKCDPATAGKGGSQQFCESTCKKVAPDQYVCNTAFKRCEKLPPGMPGGETKAECEAECHPTPAPKPPAALVGYFRGVQIQQGYAVGDFELQVNETSVTFVELQGGKIKSQWSGTPAHYEGQKLELVITLTTGPDAGKNVYTLAVFGTPGPETKQLAMAMSAPGGAEPASIVDSMTAGNGVTVYAFSECNTPDCVFTLPPMARGRHMHAHRHMLRQGAVGEQSLDADRCAQFAANCSYCLAHAFCGWCSTPVVYKDGTQGTQCAGFNAPNGSGPAFKCNGRYSTFNCTQGYQCDQTTLQCKPTAPGNGFPLPQCEQFCHATPPPTPPQKMALCNLTTKQCLPCPDNATHCPGSLPLAACEAECSHHKKGPHAAIIGIWRGIYIQNGYDRVEIDVVFDNLTATFVQAGNAPVKCDVDSLGSDLMIFTIVDGTYKGWKFTAIFQTEEQPGGFYESMTMAAGKLDGSAPSSYDEAMSTQGDRVYVLNKCTGDPCTFKNPIQVK